MPFFASFKRVFLTVFTCGKDGPEAGRPYKISEPFDFRKEDGTPFSSISEDKSPVTPSSTFSSRSNLLTSSDYPPTVDFTPRIHTAATPPRQAVGTRTTRTASLRSKPSSRALPLAFDNPTSNPSAYTTPKMSGSRPDLLLTTPSYTLLPLDTKTRSRSSPHLYQENNSREDDEAETKALTEPKGEDEKISMDLEFLLPLIDGSAERDGRYAAAERASRFLRLSSR